MTFATFLARTAQRYALVNHRALMHFRRFTNHHAAAVVDEYAAFNFCRRMNFNPRKKPSQLTEIQVKTKEGNSLNVLYVTLVGKALADGTPQTERIYNK